MLPTLDKHFFFIFFDTIPNVLQLRVNWFSSTGIWGWQLGETMLLIWALIKLPSVLNSTISSFFLNQGRGFCLQADMFGKKTPPDAMLAGIFPFTDLFQVRKYSHRV